jgi:hypothetical protein
LIFGGNLQWKEGTEFMTVLLAIIRDISCGYILASDNRERFQINNAMKKGFEDVMEHVSKK